MIRFSIPQKFSLRTISLFFGTGHWMSDLIQQSHTTHCSKNNSTVQSLKMAKKTHEITWKNPHYHSPIATLTVGITLQSHAQYTCTFVHVYSVHTIRDVTRHQLGWNEMHARSSAPHFRSHVTDLSCPCPTPLSPPLSSSGYWYSCYSLGQILYHYQLITHFNPRTIRAATVLLHVLIRPNSTRHRSCYYWPYLYK